MKKLFFVILISFLQLSFSVVDQQELIHSHNDYVRKEPFYEAFRAGSASIEADIHYIDNQLYVAHDAKDVLPNRTLTKLYLEPLVQVYKSKKNKNSEIQLLLDIKTEAISTLKALIAEIEKYPELIKGKKSRFKVHFVISGNRPAAILYSDYPDFIKFDLQELGNIEKVALDKVALVSFSFQKYSRWFGNGDISAEDKSKIIEVTSKVHNLNRKIRFWGTPDSEKAWQVFSDLGIDYINTDKPIACGAFFNVKPRIVSN